MLSLEGQKAIIALDRNGSILDEDVVKAARDPNHILHGEFIWDDALAAHRDRLRTARKLINQVMINITHETREIASYCYVRDPRSSASGGRYNSIDMVADNKQQTERTLQMELHRVANAANRFRNIATSLGLSDERIEAALASSIGVEVKSNGKGQGKSKVPPEPRPS